MKTTNLGSVEEMGGTVKASQTSTTAGPHPIYSLMGGNASGPTTKKKIVIPPRSAYNA